MQTNTKSRSSKGILKKLDQTPNDIAMNKRLGAYVIDWALGGIFTGFPAVLTYGFITGKNDMFSNLYVFEALGHEKIWGLLAGVLCILFALFYYVYVPWKLYPGQTLGKRVVGIKIEMLPHEAPSLKALLLRQAFAIFLLEGSVYVVSNYIRQLVTLITRFYVDTSWQILAVGITLLSVVLVIYTKSHRALHDYIGSTRVVNAPKIEKKDETNIKKENIAKIEKPLAKSSSLNQKQASSKCSPKHLPKKKTKESNR